MKIEIDKQLAVLKPEKQALVLGAFAPIIQELNTFGTEFPKIQEMEQTPEKSAKAKWFRIDFKKAVNLADAKRKDLKEESLKEGKAIQSVFNYIRDVTEETLDKASDIENHYINIEKAEKEIRRKDRLNELENFGVDGSGLQLGEMEDSIWQNFLLGARTQFEAAAKAEKDEAERLRKIDKAKAIHGERKDQMFKYWDFLPDQINVQDFSIYTPEEFKELLSDMVQEKDKYNKEQEETRLENEKLRIENEKIQVEKDKLEAQRIKSKRLTGYNKLAKERDERFQLENRIAEDKRQREQAGKEASKKALEEKQKLESKIAEDNRLKAEAEKTAKNAPDKEKLFIVVEYLSNTVEQISDNFAKELLSECSESILDFAEKL